MTKYLHKEWKWFCQKRPQWIPQGYWWKMPKEIHNRSIAFKQDYYTRLEALLCIRELLVELDIDPFLLMLHIDRIKMGRFYIRNRDGHKDRHKYTNLKPLTTAEKRFITKHSLPEG